jgi:maltooligosyltrehalose trehalohydrolase
MDRLSEWRLTLGARPEARGVGFRVWAPAAERVDVVLYGPSAERICRLDPAGGGYFEGFVPDIGPGGRYRYRLDEGPAYPDPASRSQPDGVHEPSEVVDPGAFYWTASDWRGRALDDLVIYEMHVGTFTRDGTFQGAAERLHHLVELGVTAIEVMPVADFPGSRNWGYDGVNLFAPAAVYGGVEGFKQLVDTAHRLGLAVILDVVYNHLGPEGNYLPAMTGGLFFTDRHHTPWGDAVNLDGPGCEAVRDFIVQNALFWCTEYRVDGLRLDATHAIYDDSEVHILAELSVAVHSLPGPRRWLIAEDERNEVRLIRSREQGGFGLDAIWADDLHHQLRRATAGDRHGYFAAYSGTVPHIVETLHTGWWAPEAHEPTADFQPSRFVHCIQNHDQVGNRATGERLNHQIPLEVYRAASALLLLSPYLPLIWMGQEWAASSPFLYFTDHPEELGRLVTEGRREEFREFPAYRDPDRRSAIPDPQADATFERSKLRWDERAEPPHAGVLALYRVLLDLRRNHPALRRTDRAAFAVEELGAGALALRRLGDRDLLALVVLRGEIRLELGSRNVTAPPDGAAWRHLLSTEEVRFGGDGGWGTLETDGTAHIIRPGAVVLEASS